MIFLAHGLVDVLVQLVLLLMVNTTLFLQPFRCGLLVPGVLSSRGRIRSWIGHIRLPSRSGGLSSKMEVQLAETSAVG